MAVQVKYLAALLALWAIPARAQNSPQSVADAARRLRTEDDLPRLQKLPISVIGQIQEDGANLSEPGLPESPNLEQQWRSRFAEAREEVARAGQEIARLQKAFNDAAQHAALAMDWSILTCPRQSGVFAPGYLGAAELNSLCSALNARKEQLVAAQQRLESLDDDLRRAGGYPGWGRE